MQYDYPGMPLKALKTQFLIGTDLLVAPILEPKSRQRVVEIPPGIWQSAGGTKTEGPQTITVSAELDQLPYFKRFTAKE